MSKLKEIDMYLWPDGIWRIMPFTEMTIEITIPKENVHVNWRALYSLFPNGILKEEYRRNLFNNIGA